MKIKNVLLALSLIFLNNCYGGDPLSSFSLTSSDIIIASPTPYDLLSQTFTLVSEKKVLVIADGRYFPHTNNGIAQVNIVIDNSSSFGNNSIINWQTSLKPAQHTFNCIASATLSPGTHTIKLIAFAHLSTPGTNFKVGSGTGLSILLDPAPNLISSALSSDFGPINYTTYPTNGFSPVPMSTIFTNQFDAGPIETNVITLSSGRSYKNCGEGDALWGLFLNNEICINNVSSMWSVNDIYNGAELQAPMYLHSFHKLSGLNNVSLKAGELSFTYFENPVCYKIGASTNIITLYGMNLSGKSIPTKSNCNREDFKCFGTYDVVSNPYGCPYIGNVTEVTSTLVNIPPGHNGIVQFLTQLRIQPDKTDAGGEALLWLNIDGIDVGTLGVQQFINPFCESSRTISASYLSTQANPLSVGTHVVKVLIKAIGSFKNIAFSLDVPLIYFD